MAKFEKVSRFADVDLAMPVRKTADSAGYDLVVAQDTVIPSYKNVIGKISPFWDYIGTQKVFELDQMAQLTKTFMAKPTLVSTGMKCKLDPGTYLELSVRSSTPLKYWLMFSLLSSQ